MSKILRAGVAGAGVFGGYHANKYQEVEGAALAAIFDVDSARAMAAAAQRKVTGFDDYRAFLDAVDVITIAAPASFHGSLAKQALEAGKSVLVEKPIALDVTTADALIALAAEKKAVLQIGHQERYVADAFGLLSRGAPKHLRSRRLNKFSGRAMDVSVIFDLMIHDLDLLAQFANTDDAVITNIKARREHGQYADFVEVDLAFPNGLSANLSASRLEETPIRDLLLHYDAGEVGLDFLGRLTRNTTATPITVSFDSDNRPPALIDPLRLGTQNFVDAVRFGRTPIVTGTDGRNALALALRIEEAACGQMES